MADGTTQPYGYSYVRMSTDIQRKGDSLRRQLELSRAYAAAHEIDLQEDFALHDIGVSAFKGRNVREGAALARFLGLVKSGEIRPGSYLLVESLDRLSRQELDPSLMMFMELVRSGINLVTLADNHLYRAGKAELTDLIYSLVVMSRAHEESLLKGQRVAAAWANKRRNISDRKLSRNCPGWLTLSADRTKFVVDEAKAEIVRTIFRDSAAGIGCYSIARRLNKAGVRSYGRKPGWHTSYITKLLQSEAVIGEFQPHRYEDGVRVPDGEPIADYFPPIVDRELFQRARQAREGRRKGAAGRRGEHFSNIFSGVAKCGYCHSNMGYVSKGPPPKGGAYLFCNRARRGLGCEGTGWRYENFEASFLAFVQELDLESLLASTEDKNQRPVLARAISALEGELADLTQKRERTYELIGSQATATDFIRTKLNEAEIEIERVNQALAIKNDQLNSLESDAGRVYRSKEEIKSLVKRLQDKGDPDIYALRSTIAARLKVLILSLDVFVSGSAPQTAAAISFLQNEETLSDDEGGPRYLSRLIHNMEGFSEEPRQQRAFFSTTLRDGRLRIIYPDPSDPLRFDEQVYSASDHELTRIGGDGVAEVIFSAVDVDHPAKNPD